MGNMDKFIFVNKNWPCDPRFSYVKPTNFPFACEARSNLMAKPEVQFEDEVEGKDFLHLHDYL